MVANVNLFGGRGGAAGGGVGRPALGGDRNHTTNRSPMSCGLSKLVKIICTVQIDWASTTAQRRTLFGSGRKTAESKLDGKLRPSTQCCCCWCHGWSYSRNCISRTIHDIDIGMKQQLLQWFPGVPNSQQWHDIWMATASQPKLLARMQTFLSNATVQWQLNGSWRPYGQWLAGLNNNRLIYVDECIQCVINARLFNQRRQHKLKTEL